MSSVEFYIAEQKLAEDDVAVLHGIVSAIVSDARKQSFDKFTIPANCIEVTTADSMPATFIAESWHDVSGENHSARVQPLSTPFSYSFKKNNLEIPFTGNTSYQLNEKEAICVRAMIATSLLNTVVSSL